MPGLIIFHLKGFMPQLRSFMPQLYCDMNEWRHERCCSLIISHLSVDDVFLYEYPC